MLLPTKRRNRRSVDVANGVATRTEQRTGSMVMDDRRITEINGVVGPSGGGR